MIKQVILLRMTLTFRRRDGGQYLLFNDFTGFLSVAVNTIMDKRQFILFFKFIFLEIVYLILVMLKLRNNLCAKLSLVD